jgi:para-nitrobenzyl esterase
MPENATGWRLRSRLAAGVVAASALAGCTTAAGVAPAAATGTGSGLVAQTRLGAVRGTVAGGIREFLGIPYAAPPTGKLRWQPPAPPAHWTGVRRATQFAPHCPQSASPFGRASTSEDCLFLNVFTAPGRSRAGRPVMVWIHGGALVTGESDDYDPAALVRDGVTVVTVNYRLGALGFLADSALAGPTGAAGDYGLMDQQAALRWVQANIGRFGGDARNVTLFGESAGGLSTLSQLVSPGARGLFQRAIVESGSYDLTQAPLAGAEAAGTAFAAKAGCGTEPGAAATAACLRAVPVGTVLADQDAGGYTPDVDGAVLTQSIGTALQQGQFSRVPVVMGTNHDEWRLFVGLSRLEGGPVVTAANYLGEIQGTVGASPAVAAQIAARYPAASYPSPAAALGAVGTDAIFACPSLKAVTLLSKFTPTFAYEFNDENAPERFLPGVGFPYGAAHASEIQYLFGVTTQIPAALTPAQARLAAQMRGYWTSQAARGRPAAAGQAAWPRFTAATQPVLSLNTSAPAVETNFSAAHNCAFWAGIAAAGD